MDKDRAVEAIAAIKDVLDSPVAFTVRERLDRIRAIVEAAEASPAEPDEGSRS